MSDLLFFAIVLVAVPVVALLPMLADPVGRRALREALRQRERDIETPLGQRRLGRRELGPSYGMPDPDEPRVHRG